MGGIDVRRITFVISIIAIIASIFTSCSGKKIGNGNELKFQYESNHFKFYCLERDKNSLQNLEKYLELAYPKITDDLKANFDKKIDARIYPSTKEFKEAIQASEVPDWVVGDATQGDIRIVSPNSPPNGMEYIEIIAASIHEFTHLVSSKILSPETRWVFWIQEGISTFEAKQKLGPTAKQRLYTEAMNNSLPPITELEGRNDKMNGQYEYAYSLVEYSINKYGYEKFNEFIRKEYSKNDFINVFGISKEEFNQGWSKYIKQNYNQ